MNYNTDKKKKSMAAPNCGVDCFHCPFPDCINDRITQDERRESMLRDSELKERSKVAAAKKAYYEANREKVAAAKKAYYEANREKVAAVQKGRELRDFRTEHGMTQSALGKFLGGVSQPTISSWETGAVPFDLDSIRAKFEGRG